MEQLLTNKVTAECAADINRRISADQNAADKVRKSIERVKIKAFVREWLLEYNKVAPQERVDMIIDKIHRQLSDLGKYSG